MKMVQTDKAAAMLRDKGMSITQPRLAILDYMMTHHTHPTVETIYSDLIKEYPGISKTTVYNTVQMFTQKGLLQTLCIDDTHVNLDGNTTPHAHLLCKCCGRITDLPLRGITEKEACRGFMMEGSLVEEVHQYYRGICSGCMAKQ